MSIDDLPENLKLLCSYGRSISDLCRRAKINRQQFNKYLSGQTRPSLSTLRRICDFFGVEEHEMLMDRQSFLQLIRVRPPVIGKIPEALEKVVGKVIRGPTNDQSLLARHQGYYHTHICPDPARGYIIRSLCRIYKQNDIWVSKTVERYPHSDLMLPGTVKYSGIALEAYHRLVVYEREQGAGRSLWASMLFTSEHTEPKFLSGLTMGMTPEGSHDINCMRSVWQYLGARPNLRTALSQCGIIEPDAPDVATFVRECTDNSRLDNELMFMPRF